MVRAAVEQSAFFGLHYASAELQHEYRSDRAGFVARAEAEDAARAAAVGAPAAQPPLHYASAELLVKEHAKGRQKEKKNGRKTTEAHTGTGILKLRKPMTQVSSPAPML